MSPSTARRRSSATSIGCIIPCVCYRAAMLTVYLVRHGQTDFSGRNTFWGRIDPPLSEVGGQRAEALGARYGGEGWAAIYASTLVRTQQTAEPVARRAGVTVEVDADL